VFLRVLVPIKGHTMEETVSKQTREERILKAVSGHVAEGRRVPKETIGKRTKITSSDIVYLCGVFEGSQLLELRGACNNLVLHEGMTVEQLSGQLASKGPKARRRIIEAQRVQAQTH
tara:strand:+ start:1420 stop:1770 length:351 start_codon:yes stop_codon:yes gene_type:complete